MTSPNDSGAAAHVGTPIPPNLQWHMARVLPRTVGSREVVRFWDAHGLPGAARDAFTTPYPSDGLSHLLSQVDWGEPVQRAGILALIEVLLGGFLELAQLTDDVDEERWAIQNHDRLGKALAAERIVVTSDGRVQFTDEAGPASATAELVSRSTRRAFREALVGEYLAAIEDLYRDEGFEPSSAPTGNTSGRGRVLIESFHNGIDWADAGDVQRALRVFSHIYREADQDQQELLRSALSDDGLEMSDTGMIQQAALVDLTEIPIAVLEDARALSEHLARMRETVESDPPLAISAARALIEAVTKRVLAETETQYDERAEIPRLVRQAQKALRLHPESIAPTAKGQETIVRLLSNLSQVAIGVAELRSEYGSDHGRTEPTPSGLGPRHAHLAVGSAGVYCRILLETLAARSRPSDP